MVDDNSGSPQVLADDDGGNNIVMGIGSSTASGFACGWFNIAKITNK